MGMASLSVIFRKQLVFLTCVFNLWKVIVNSFNFIPFYIMKDLWFPVIIPLWPKYSLKIEGFYSYLFLQNVLKYTGIEKCKSKLQWGTIPHLLGWLKLKRQQCRCWWGGAKNWDPVGSIGGGTEMVWLLQKIVPQLKKVSIAIPLLENRKHMSTHKKTLHTGVHSSQKHGNNLMSMNSRKDSWMWYICTMEYYLAVEKKVSPVLWYDTSEPWKQDSV